MLWSFHSTGGDRSAAEELFPKFTRELLYEQFADRVEELISSEPAKAEKAIRTALALAPDDRALMTRLAHVLVTRHNFESSLEVCEKMPPPLSTSVSAAPSVFAWPGRI